MKNTQRQPSLGHNESQKRRRNDCPYAGTRVEETKSQRTFPRRKPFRHCLARPGKSPAFSHAQQKSEHAEPEHRRHRPVKQLAADHQTIISA
jgi:hypothetical protein